MDSGYGYGSLTELPEAPGTGIEVSQKITDVPGVVARAYITHRNSGYE